MSSMPITEPTIGMIMIFKSTFSACISVSVHILNFQLNVSRMGWAFQNQFITSMPPKTFLSFRDLYFSGGTILLVKPDTRVCFSMSVFLWQHS